MLSPCCNDSTEVYDSRPAPKNRIRRRRKCQACGRRWATVEITTHELIVDPASSDPTHPRKKALFHKPIIFFPDGRVRVMDVEVIATSILKVLSERAK